MERAGLLLWMFAQFGHVPTLSALVLSARRAGGPAHGVLSDSWVNDYPIETWDEMFDAIVICGEGPFVSPSRILTHVLRRLGVTSAAPPRT